MANLVISRVSTGSAIKDKLTEGDVGLNHGDVSTAATTLEEILYIRHDDAVNPITDLKLYIDNLSEILSWADAVVNDGLLLDTDNDGNFDVSIKTGIGDSLVNAINLGAINPGEEKVIRLKIKVPTSVSATGVRKFNTNFEFDFTP